MNFVKLETSIRYISIQYRGQLPAWFVSVGKGSLPWNQATWFLFVMEL